VNVLPSDPQRGWVYDPDGDRFEDRVGRVLSRGINLRDTFREQAHTTTMRQRVSAVAGACAWAHGQRRNAHRRLFGSG